MTCVLGIIPARGGSKGIPDKNIAEAGGKPLIAWTIEAAQKSKCLTHIIVSTDSEKIAAAARSCGLPVDGLRPAELSSDEAATLDVVRYEIERFEKEHNAHVSDVVLLQPTAPFRDATDIDAAFDIYRSSRRDSLISVYNGTHVHPNIMYKKSGDALIPFLEKTTLVRRQEMEQVFIRNGAIYIASQDLIMREGKMVGAAPACYVMPRSRSLNIDEPHDLAIARNLLHGAAG